MDDCESDADLRLLLAPGSSLGGARPKASVRDGGGCLSIAKFPQDGDEVSTVLWEAVALTLAENSNIRVSQWWLETVAKKPVLLLRRFDRDGEKRIPFLSAMSMLGAKDNEQRSYLELADILRQFGAAPKVDMHSLWRRMVFNILISNTDDHLRNHAFLYEGQVGWRLSPAYDLNPMPVDIKPRILSTAIDLDSGVASLELAFSVANYFQLSKKEAVKVAAEVGAAVSNWREVALKVGLKSAEIERMSSAFEHADLKQALK
jgi:serine/threonine-protein kinase HipA